MFVYNGLVCDIFAFFVIKSRGPYWEFEIQGQGVPWCPQYEIEDKNTSCIFYFSICKDVPEYCPEGSGICLANKVSPNNTNITLYTRFINIGTTSDNFKSGRTQTQLNLDSCKLRDVIKGLSLELRAQLFEGRLALNPG